MAAQIHGRKNMIPKAELVAAIDDGANDILKLMSHLHRGKYAINRALAQYGIALLPPYDPERAAIVAEVCRRYDTGERPAEIATTMRLGIQVVHRILVKAGKHVSKKPDLGNADTGTCPST